ncbi:I78 family peptidase inhibitor [Seohaeicola saemankumensis]|uniref:I78 family peptidase inhibitor n=1 Tax=Seohaeicola saemankumensis TaxID=481181 RepID=A0ABW3TEH6_9RHOB
MGYNAPAAFGAILFLMACMPENPATDSAAAAQAAAQAAAVPPADACGAATLQSLVGQPVVDQDFSGIGTAQRIMADGSPMTMDYRADRLNVTYDGKGRITRIWCG